MPTLFAAFKKLMISASLPNRSCAKNVSLNSFLCFFFSMRNDIPGHLEIIG